MKCSLDISNFLEEISSLSHCTVFLYFFALITEEDFLISPCYSLELCIQMGISFLFSFALCSLLFTAIHKASSDRILLSSFSVLSAYSKLFWLFTREKYALWIISPTFHHSAQCLKQLSVSAYARNHIFMPNERSLSAQIKFCVFEVILDNSCVPTLWLFFSDFNAFQFPND